MSQKEKNSVNEQDIELIIGNSNSNFSGVTSTMLQVLSHEQALINLRVMGKHHLPDESLSISFWQVARLCVKPLASGKFRIFHARRVDEMIQALILKHIFRVKLKIVFSSAAQRHRSGFTLWLTDRMDAVLAMCKASASYLHRKPDAIIYHGVKTDIYLPATDKSQAWQSLDLLPKNSIKGKQGIAILGRVRQQKGVHLFVEACIALLKDKPDYTAVVVGSISSSNESFVNELQLKIAQAGLTDRIIFAGEQNFADIPKIFSSLSLVVALSENEGFGLTILEAMSSGAAVLASEAGAWPEVVREGVDGYVVPVNDLAAVTEKMSLLLADEEKLMQMGRSGRERVLAHYSVEREAKELVTFFRGLM
ncbi:glycosyltransferase family 4 protein [Colwellia ponticola]|uniref:Glycosyltransferase family 4 protein n=1 Tax=Colwellia ponticola TaxID=2304625 RepID=A0A8H2JN59_9GAMM|nr:glycosyltransferase family 4 protein [Colwellia ponticola]TMM47510.1 glycosyltransferase family 4 protein [Colwellia ponticola]